MMGLKELRAKLEWLAQAQVGEPLPDWLGGSGPMAWGQPISEITQVMEPWTRDLPAYYRWRGLIQLPRISDHVPWIQEGWAYWFKSRHPNSEPAVRWACSNGLCTPEFFQPFPEAQGRAHAAAATHIGGIT